MKISLLTILAIVTSFTILVSGCSYKKNEYLRSESDEVKKIDRILWSSLGRYSTWGDYGTVLIHGLLNRDSNSRFLIVARSDTPKILVSRGSLIVNKELYQKIRENYPSIIFSQITKIVQKKIPWESWPNTSEPRVYPPTGDPYDYLYENYFPEVDRTNDWNLYCVEVCSTVDFSFDGSKSYCSEDFYNFLLSISGDESCYLQGLALGN
ncbi:hypothetical protein SAMN02745181_2057 [Rubritalea squalenifaciens DSM 18772]|uniref:Lipoprotein n=1 Tax=Rubritalea squalenifaciens DSM 18772 TaxID=1123071 RepID=A0A1M6JA56_9BACT|nr:hypothetical protein [Rubritalea squalenifaciens]SHJ43587.1 hypothetical protein SAMN02745181_2057 [Rubritalea squalenifaciens DSM 18772]